MHNTKYDTIKLKIVVTTHRYWRVNNIFWTTIFALTVTVRLRYYQTFQVHVSKALIARHEKYTVTTKLQGIVLCDVIRRLQEGILCFGNAIRFHSSR